MDVRYITHFVAAIQRVFKTMVHTTVQIGKPEIKRPQVAGADVSGMIGLSGDVRGCVAICFPMDVAEKSASSFAGTALTSKHPDFADAIGELANMVAGSAKSDFKDMNVSISLPSVVIGRDLELLPARTHPQIYIPCNCEFGSFFVEVGLMVGRSTANATLQTAGASA